MDIMWQKYEEDFFSKVEKDDLLVVLNFSHTEHDLVKKLASYTQASMQQSFHYCQTQLGFLENTPFAIMEFSETSSNNLEKRFLLSKAFNKVKKTFSKSSLKVVVCSDEFAMLDTSVAEDLVSTYYEKFYKESSLENVQFFHTNITSSDLKKEKIRYKYNISFRSWINENPDDLTSIEIGKRLEAFSDKHANCEFSSLGLEDLKKLGMNLLLAVGQGSELSPSRCHFISANLSDSDEKPTMLVGKGITFDTGGINVKPFESHVNCMKNDMGGAALMSNLFMAMIEAGYKKPLVLVIPSCENLVAQKSMKPGSIVKSYKGKEVVIEHTDAEGRLILADALAYGEQKYQPKKTFVAATLTTAALRQYTNYFTPVHFADEQFKSSLKSYGDRLGEGFVFWDHFAPFKDANLTPAADLTNMGRLNGAASIGGGSSCAAHFLNEFVDGPLIHFDIFASTWNWSNDYPGAAYGATGAPFNAVFETLLEQ